MVGMGEMRELRTTTACVYMDNAGTLAISLWGRPRAGRPWAGLPEKQRILRRQPWNKHWPEAFWLVANRLYVLVHTFALSTFF